MSLNKRYSPHPSKPSFNNITTYNMGMSTKPGALNFTDNGQMYHRHDNGLNSSGMFVGRMDARDAVLTEARFARYDERRIRKNAEVKLRQALQEHLEMTNSFLEELLIHVTASNKAIKQGKKPEAFKPDYPTFKVLREQITRNSDLLDDNYQRLEKMGAIKYE